MKGRARAEVIMVIVLTMRIWGSGGTGSFPPVQKRTLFGKQHSPEAMDLLPVLRHEGDSWRCSKAAYVRFWEHFKIVHCRRTQSTFWSKIKPGSQIYAWGVYLTLSMRILLMQTVTTVISTGTPFEKGLTLVRMPSSLAGRSFRVQHFTVPEQGWRASTITLFSSWYHHRNKGIFPNDNCWCIYGRSWVSLLFTVFLGHTVLLRLPYASSPSEALKHGRKQLFPLWRLMPVWCCDMGGESL